MFFILLQRGVKTSQIGGTCGEGAIGGIGGVDAMGVKGGIGGNDTCINAHCKCVFHTFLSVHFLFLFSVPE